MTYGLTVIKPVFIRYPYNTYMPKFNGATIRKETRSNIAILKRKPECVTAYYIVNYLLAAIGANNSNI